MRFADTIRELDMQCLIFAKCLALTAQRNIVSIEILVQKSSFDYRLASDSGQIIEIYESQFPFYISGTTTSRSDSQDLLCGKAMR